MKLCPVCESQFDEKGAAADKRMVHYFGDIYYLMCQECKGMFMRNPDQYAGRERMNAGPPSAPRNLPEAACRESQENDSETRFTG